MATNLKPLPAWLDRDERQAERWPMNMAAFLQSEVRPTLVGVRVVDISTHGCLLAVPGGMSMGRYVTLTLPGSIAAEGWIAWSKGDHAGMDFAHPMPMSIVELMISDRSVAG